MAEQNLNIVADGINDRIMMFVEAEGFKLSEFADKLGIPRSRMTHIKNKRNKPNIDFIVKLLETFPNLNPEWLLLGVGSMYKKPVHKSEPVGIQANTQPPLFQQANPNSQTTTPQTASSTNNQTSVNNPNTINNIQPNGFSGQENEQCQPGNVNQQNQNLNYAHSQPQQNPENPQMQTPQFGNQQNNINSQPISQPVNNQMISGQAAVIPGPDGTPQQILILFPDRTFVAYKPREDN